MHGSSQMPCPPMNGQLSQGFSIDKTHGSQDPPSLKSQRAAKKKNVARRGTAFTKEEDLWDSAKRHRSKSFTETSSSSTAVEVLQRLQEKSEKTEQKQDQQMTEILSRKDEKIKIQRDLFNLQKKHMKMSVQQKKKENAIREKESEAHLISVESSIMSVDIEKVPFI
ncbi:unnamed protein product [Miscanthus lutarioriparius]|uniref:No apical meristem-associated C-terminal domain-containing protein n=1 Tax=Miscanthus lutarioriparius TaxID=422564 RepID=A0A811RJZ7_9POAL|nr:unnamed protein product [Miscanthus lutarioriparius]